MLSQNPNTSVTPRNTMIKRPEQRRCGEEYGKHPTKPHLSAICTRPRGHDGEHSNVLHKPGEDPDRDRGAK